MPKTPAVPGMPSDVPSGWEYRRLNIRTRHSHDSGTPAHQRYGELVSAALIEVRLEGWELDEPGDLAWAIEAGRLKTLTVSGISAIWSGRTRHESVTLRVRRPEAGVGSHWNADISWFDVLKELNAHGGRLASLTALLWAVLIYTVMQSPVSALVNSKVLGLFFGLGIDPLLQCYRQYYSLFRHGSSQ